MAKKRRDGYKEQAAMARRIDELDEFEQYRQEILPLLRDAIKRKKTSKEIRALVQSYLTARIATIALTEQDSGKALAAARDLVDREEGKAVERKHIKHTLDELSDQELTALLQSEMTGIKPPSSKLNS